MEKKVIIMMTTMFAICFFLVGCGKITTGMSSEDMTKLKYDEVIEQLSAVGFENITANEIDDLTSKEIDREDIAESIMIDGKDSFLIDDKFSKKADIQIEYHRIKRINMPASSDEMCNMDYDAVNKMITDAGFININLNEINDLSYYEIAKENIVSEIKINNIDKFDVENEFVFDAEIVLTYHTVIRYEMPIGSVEAETVDYIELTQQLQEIGFTNVITEEVVDIDPDTFNGEFKNEFVIEGISSFEIGDMIPYDQEIKIINHRPYEKYNIKVFVDFDWNLLFDKYDVNVKFDGVSQGTIPHGEEASYEFRVKSGNHKLAFTKIDDDSVSGILDFGEVVSDIEGSYKIKGHSNVIDVTKIYEDRNIAVATDEVKMPAHVDAYIGRDNLEVDKELKDLGFTNVKRMVYYDLRSSDGEGLTNKVVINGNSSFKKGEIYKKNAAVVVYFRSQESNDPKVIAKKEAEAEEARKDAAKKTIIRTSGGILEDDVILACKNNSGSEIMYHIILRDKTVVYFGEESGLALTGTWEADKKEVGVYNITWDYDTLWRERLVDNVMSVKLIDKDGFDWKFSRVPKDGAAEAYNRYVKKIY